MHIDEMRSGMEKLVVRGNKHLTRLKQYTMLNR